MQATATLYRGRGCPRHMGSVAPPPTDIINNKRIGPPDVVVYSHAARGRGQRQITTSSGLVGQECPTHTCIDDDSAGTNRDQRAYGNEVPRAVAADARQSSQ